MKKFKLQLSKLMDKYNFEVIEFNYYKQIFGNIVLKIKKMKKNWILLLIEGKSIVMANYYVAMSI